MITNSATDKKFPLGHYWANLSKAYVGALVKRLETSSVDRYYMVIQVLGEVPGPFTQRSLGDFLNIDKVSMVRIIDHLMERGLIERRNNPDDRREKFIVLTEKGQKSVGELSDGIAEVNSRTLKGFSQHEINDLYRMLERMNDNLGDLPTKKIYLNFKRSKK